jgi:hypothetical protein
MATWKSVQRIGAKLPEVEEGTQHGRNPVLRVGGKVFISGDEESCSVATEEREALLLSSPEIYESIPHHEGTIWIKVRLAKISVAELREIMTDSWRIRAPKRVRKAHPNI